MVGLGNSLGGVRIHVDDSRGGRIVTLQPVVGLEVKRRKKNCFWTGREGLGTWLIKTNHRAEVGDWDRSGAQGTTNSTFKSVMKVDCV